MTKSLKLKLKVATARQTAFNALQGGRYRDAAKACTEAEKFQNKLMKGEKELAKSKPKAKAKSKTKEKAKSKGKGNA